VCHRSDRNLGARDFDWEIAKVLSAEFEKKHGDNPLQNARSTLRLLEGVEKARKMLSATPEAQINIEYLLNEEDLNRTIKKDEFEAIIDPFIRRFSALVKDAI